MTQLAEDTGVPTELIDQLVEDARGYGSIHLDMAMMKLRVELTPDVLAALKAACDRAGVTLDEGIEDGAPPDEELTPADEVTRARKRRAAARTMKTVKTAAGGSSDSVRMYLREIGRVPLLTGAEEVSIAKRIEKGEAAKERLADLAAGDELDTLPFQERRKMQRWVRDGDLATSELIQANLRLVVSIAKRYVGRGMQLLDLIQEGNLGLIHAVEKFDHRKGFTFSTYATWWIRQAITRGVANTARTIRLPVHAHDLLKQIDKARGMLESKLGRPPTLDELSTEVGHPPSKIEEILASARIAKSLDDGLSDDGDMTLGDLAAVAEDDPEGDAVTEATRGDVLAGLKGLDDREQRILILRYGLDGHEPRTLDEVGRHFDLTRERIRQIEARAMSKLRHPANAGILADLAS